MKEEVRVARKRKRKSRRRLEGRKILELVPHYYIESGEDKPVTAARKYIRANQIQPPAVVVVKRNEHTTDRFFWAEKGLFGAQYVEENHFLFPSLRMIRPQVKANATNNSANTAATNASVTNPNPNTSVLSSGC